MGYQAIEIGRAEERELEIELRRPHEREVDRPQVRVRPHPLELDAQDPLEPDVLDRRIHVGERHLCVDRCEMWEMCGRSVGDVWEICGRDGVWEMCGRCVGDVWEMSRSSRSGRSRLGWEISGRDGSETSVLLGGNSIPRCGKDGVRHMGEMGHSLNTFASLALSE